VTLANWSQDFPIQSILEPIFKQLPSGAALLATLVMPDFVKPHTYFDDRGVKLELL
jgi:hypothetical protein